MAEMYGIGVLLVMIDGFSGRTDCYIQISTLFFGKRMLRRNMGGGYYADQKWFLDKLEKIITSNLLKKKHNSSSWRRNGCQTILRSIDRRYKNKHTEEKLVLVSCRAEMGNMMVQKYIFADACISSICRYLSDMVDVDRIAAFKPWRDRQRESL
ncbi:hypothetical protein ACSSZE_08940 [Acidithiobacillus caldus]